MKLIKDKQTLIIWILIPIVLVIGIFANRFLWHDGVCRKCGGEMKYIDTEYETVRHKNNNNSIAHHIYECGKCGNHVDLRIDPQGIYGFVYK